MPGSVSTTAHALAPEPGSVRAGSARPTFGERHPLAPKLGGSSHQPVDMGMVFGSIIIPYFKDVKGYKLGMLFMPDPNDPEEKMVEKHAAFRNKIVTAVVGLWTEVKAYPK